MDYKSFYITTTLPYVNANPHIGFALELVQADAIARYQKIAGYEIFFNTGTDEHGIKVYRSAENAGKSVEEYTEEKSNAFANLAKELGITNYNFVRTTDEGHKKAAQEFWKRCSKDIEKKLYKVKYCVGCELEKTDSELEDGKCPIHKNIEIEEREEENYFFKFSNYKEKLLKLYDESQNFVVPESRLNEIRNFIKNGPRDFSISRLSSKLPWGVPVPDDDEHVMYVWFDALVNYISVIGWPDDDEKFNKWWPGVQIAGKDNLRQQAAMWQAMLMSSGLPPSKQILIHGFITSGGEKMSKSTGNVLDPFEIIEKYGAEALRYYLLRHIPTFEDGDFTEEHFVEMYNAHLANGLGNLVSRIMKMYVTLEENIKLPSREEVLINDSNITTGAYKEFLDKFLIHNVVDMIWLGVTPGGTHPYKGIRGLDKYIQDNEPYKKLKTNKKEAKEDIFYLVSQLWYISIHLEPFMPETADKIQKIVKENKMPEPLFKRI